MKIGFEKRLFVVWLALSAITLAQLGIDSLDDRGVLVPNAWITVSIVLIALIKVRLILREFMELRHARARLVRLADLWVLVTGGALLGSYFLGLALWAN